MVLTAKKAALEKAAADSALEKAAAEAKLAEELSGILRQFVLLLHEAIVECALISLLQFVLTISSCVVLTAKKAALEKAATEAKLAEELAGILRQLVLL